MAKLEQYERDYKGSLNFIKTHLEARGIKFNVESSNKYVLHWDFKDSKISKATSNGKGFTYKLESNPNADTRILLSQAKKHLTKAGIDSSFLKM